MNPRQNNRCTRWMAPACLVIATALLSGMAQAQTGGPRLVLSGASVFQGNAGTKILSLPLNFIGTPGASASPS